MQSYEPSDRKIDCEVSRRRHVPIEETQVFRLYVETADRVWRVVKRWAALGPFLLKYL